MITVPDPIITEEVQAVDRKSANDKEIESVSLSVFKQTLLYMSHLANVYDVATH